MVPIDTLVNYNCEQFFELTLVPSLQALTRQHSYVSMGPVLYSKLINVNPSENKTAFSCSHLSIHIKRRTTWHIVFTSSKKQPLADGKYGSFTCCSILPQNLSLLLGVGILGTRLNYANSKFPNWLNKPYVIFIYFSKKVLNSLNNSAGIDFPDRRLSDSPTSSRARKSSDRRMKIDYRNFASLKPSSSFGVVEIQDGGCRG